MFVHFKGSWCERLWVFCALLCDKCLVQMVYFVVAVGFGLSISLLFIA